MNTVVERDRNHRKKRGIHRINFEGAAVLAVDGLDHLPVFSSLAGFTGDGGEAVFSCGCPQKQHGLQPSNTAARLQCRWLIALRYR